MHWYALCLRTFNSALQSAHILFIEKSNNPNYHKIAPTAPANALACRSNDGDHGYCKVNGCVKDRDVVVAAFMAPIKLVAMENVVI